MHGIGNDVLDIHKIQKGKMEIEILPIPLDSFIRSIIRCHDAMTVVQISRPVLITKDGETDSVKKVQVDLSASLAGLLVGHKTYKYPKIITGDPLRLQQCIMNLIGNSLKFTLEGSVKVTIILTEIIDAHSAHIKFLVTDTGIGFSQQLVPKLLRPFSQANTSIGRTFGGTGLGLAIVHALVTMMGGELDVISCVNEGTKISFTLLMEVLDWFESDQSSISLDISPDPETKLLSFSSDDIGPATVKMTQHEDNGLSLNGAGAGAGDIQTAPLIPLVPMAPSLQHILVVEDNGTFPDNFSILTHLTTDPFSELIQKLTKKMLTAKGYTVLTASNGLEAIQIFESNMKVIDLILMDLMMPVMNGMDAVLEMRRRRWSVPILVRSL